MTPGGDTSQCLSFEIEVEPEGQLLAIAFVADAESGETITIIFCPQAREICLGVTSVGRGTSVIGERKGPHPNQKRDSSSTKIISEFPDLRTNGPRHLRIIVSRKLRPISELEEKRMVSSLLISSVSSVSVTSKLP